MAADELKANLKADDPIMRELAQDAALCRAYLKELKHQIARAGNMLNAATAGVERLEKIWGVAEPEN